MTRLVPAEWEAHQNLWIGFPSHNDLWQEDLIPAQAEVAAFARIMARWGDERVKLLVHGPEALSAAQGLLSDIGSIDYIDAPFGDIWLRDTGPIYIHDQHQSPEVAVRPVCFLNNGWGGKYQLEHDDKVAALIAAHDQKLPHVHPFILEGGALEHDGQGTILTTRQCLLNPNRNSDWDEERAGAALKAALGARKVLWLEDGLLNDHTDGHIDNLARFVAPGIVVCPVAITKDDPNHHLYEETTRQLNHMRDARDVALTVVRVPSPGRVEGPDGEPVAASHMNFLIGNNCVVVPVYDQILGDKAVEVLQGLFSERKVVGLSSRALISGGGSFHCISQQVPAR
jgi:agmatine deiminase